MVGQCSQDSRLRIIDSEAGNGRETRRDEGNIEKRIRNGESVEDSLLLNCPVSLPLSIEYATVIDCK